MGGQQGIQSLIAEYGQHSGYQALHWEGGLADYLAIIEEAPMS